jgi:LysM repeat protein
MKGLVSDMRSIKQEIGFLPKNLKPQQTKLSRSHPTATKTDRPSPDAQGRIIIQEGDTLWQLAQSYQVSVPQLREWNSLSSDLIMTGLRLKITGHLETDEDQSDHVETFTPAPATIKNNHSAPAQKAPQPTGDVQVAVPSESTHILSLASPQSDSHESP